MTRDIPDSVYITLNTPSYEVSYYISLDDDEWAKVIVEQTWEKDMLCSEQEVNVSCEMPHNDKHNPDLSILAHISGKNMDVPCEQCQAWEYNAGGWFSQCRLNAVYPESTTCTSCAYGGRECSFKNDHDLEKKYFSRDVRTKMSHVLIADATDQLADLIINCGHKASENN